MILTLAVQASAATPVAKFGFSAGFSIRPGSSTVTIFDNGLVEYKGRFLERSAGTWKEESMKVAKLSKETMKKVQDAVSKVSAKDLIDDKAGQPQCMDAPSSAYIAIQSDKTEVTVGARIGCHNFENSTSEARLIVDLLKGLSAATR